MLRKTWCYVAGVHVKVQRADNKEIEKKGVPLNQVSKTVEGDIMCELA